MRGLVVLLVAVVLMVSFGFVAISINGVNNKIIKATEENQNFEFGTFTSAVCESKEGLNYCKDELFVNCNGKISKANDVVECNNIRLDAQKVSGFAVFGNDWEDIRD